MRFSSFFGCLGPGFGVLVRFLGGGPGFRVFGFGPFLFVSSVKGGEYA